ncbi:MAG TPA: MBL fold metallo-hydrolase [Vicinamibacterales bacterium]|nr:MBL fold metallo-hydrolase [Vicinamibacterales bacterium]
MTQTMKMTIVVAVGGLCLATALRVQAQQPPAVQGRIDAARELAGTRYQRAMTRLCLPRNGRPRPELPASVAPVRVFDNLYFVGLPDVYAWALDTGEGIILFDSLNNSRDAQMTVVGGMTQLGLDPARIRYVVISHEHADHYGGARYLQQRFGARVVASDAAWRAMAGSSPTAAPEPPNRDMVVADGDTLSLGATTLRFYSTPGHTSGALSTVVPVTESGQRHLAFLLGGPRTVSLATSREMLASTQRIATLAKAAGVDVELNDHSYIDDSLPTLEAVRSRQPGQSNPFVIGLEGFQRFAGWQIECLGADVARGEY